MQVVINIPENEIPAKQDIISVDIHFMDGKIVECDYPFIELPPRHEYIDRIFGNLTDEERDNLWMYMILTVYLESISPLNNKENLSWLGKSCKDCINGKRKKLGILPQGFDYALCWAKSGA